MKAIYCLVAATGLSLAACTRGEETPEKVIGYAPIYQSDPQVQSIKSIGPQPLASGGKIYVTGQDLFQVETGKGIHVFDIQHPEQPVKKAFLQIPGAQELSVKGNLLYSNNYNDLVVIDITDVQHIRLISRIAGVFHLSGGSYPPDQGYFECIDPEKGPVAGWEKKMLYSPKCRY